MVACGREGEVVHLLEESDERKDRSRLTRRQAGLRRNMEKEAKEEEKKRNRTRDHPRLAIT